MHKFVSAVEHFLQNTAMWRVVDVAAP